MVRASSSAWVGCSCVPSPALMMEWEDGAPGKCGAPLAAWRITMASGRMAASVFRVSTSDSALGNAGPRGGDRNRVAAQALGGDFEAGAGARGGFVKQVDDHLPAQRIQLLDVLALNGLEILGARQQGFDLGAIQFFDSEQSGGHVSSGCGFFGPFAQEDFFHPVDFLKFHFDDSISVVCTLRPI